MKIWNMAMCMTAVLFVIQGCVKDNLGDCGLSIRVQYTMNKDEVDRLGERVHHLTLYVFDSNGTFVAAYPSRGELYNGYTIPLLLKAGNYDFVVWGNLGEDYEIPALVPGKTQVQELNLKFKKVGADNRVIEFPDSLYYGTLKTNVRPALLDEQVYTIDLIKNTKKITVIASGLPLSGPDSEGVQFDCNIVSQNAGLRFFDNRISENTKVTYVPHTRVDEQERQISEFMVIREIQDRSTDSHLVYTRTNTVTGQVKTVLDRSLVDMLLSYISNRRWDLTIEDDFVIQITFDIGSFTTASITINGWEYETIHIEV
ncbi:MAG: FimB/Mfa2 family fimbrial subunit [Tannerella sp.]|nr:FimB/Mfa2 family fimbrial subunit [Tannerella sp.]